MHIFACLCGNMRKGDILAFAGMCPYLKDAKSVERTVCECARFTFPDRIARREILYGYCGHPTAWKICPLKKTMDNFYERKYDEDARKNC